MPLLPALLYFAVPAFVLVLSVYGLIPFFIQQGFTEFMSYSLALLFPLIALFVAALAALRMEGYAVNRETIQERFRLRKMDRTDWLWTIICLVIMFVGAGIFGVLGQILITKGVIPLPAKIPTALLDPTIDLVNVTNTFVNALGPNVHGNWGLLIFYLILLFFNIFGEEFWWRGVALPRQELVHGDRTWILHGFMWTLFHAFKYWSWIGLLPVCLAISYVAQKRKNTWPGIITHFIFNGSGLIPLVIAILN